jgi:hypothetical protein
MLLRPKGGHYIEYIGDTRRNPRVLDTGDYTNSPHRGTTQNIDFLLEIELASNLYCTYTF